jgi:hypothetical protein
MQQINALETPVSAQTTVQVPYGEHPTC